MKQSTVYAMVVAASFFWGANFVLAGPVMVDFPPLWAAALRFLFGAAIMFGIARWRGEKLSVLARSHAWVYVVLGVVGIGCFNIMFFYALQHTSAVNAALIMGTNPLLTALLAAILMGEQPSARHLAGLPLALIGVGIVVSGGDLSKLAALHIARGDALMLGANLAWALYNVMSRRYLPKGSAIANTTLVMITGAILLLVIALSSGTRPTLPGTESLLALTIMTIGGTVLAYLFWNTGIARLGASRTALFLNLVPVFAMLMGVVTGVIPSMAQLAGGALVLAGISISMLPKRKLALS